MKNKLVFIIIHILCILYSPADAQSTNLRELFLAAESYFLFEEFEEALPLYLRIHRQSPDNDNISFKIGVCYLNLPYEQDKSVSYLEKAIQNINPKYKENNFRETSAPPEALFFLGNAYRVNNMLKQSREAYSRFLEIIDKKVYDEELVQNQIKAIEVAEVLMKRPGDLDIEILPGNINSRFSDKYPVVSGNEKHMIYVSRLQFYDAVLYTEKINGEWSAPRNIIPELGVDGDVFPTSLSWDGTELYVYRSDNFIGNIYYSKRVGKNWTTLEKLNENINTKYWESHASLSKDGKSLYFTSNRINGYGGLDIYISQRLPNDNWGPAVNLGPTINSKYNEETPFITEDDNKLFFSSYGHYNMGGYDVFVSERQKDGTWSEPRNLGYPVNTTDDDLFFHPVKNGNIAYYSRYKEDGFGRHDIYRYTIYGPDNPRLFPITGSFDYSGEKPDTSDVHITIMNAATKKRIVDINPFKDGVFRFNIPAGTYDMVVKSKDFRDHTQKIEVPVTTPHSGLIIPGKILLTPVRTAVVTVSPDKLITISDTLLNVDSDKEVRLRFEAERGSKVIINVYNEIDSLIEDSLISDLEINISPEEKIAETFDSVEIKIQRKMMPKILILSGIIIFSGFIFLFLVWEKRRKKKKE